jgi:hypothetical protein
VCLYLPGYIVENPAASANFLYPSTFAARKAAALDLDPGGSLGGASPIAFTLTRVSSPATAQLQKTNIPIMIKIFFPMLISFCIF